MKNSHSLQDLFTSTFHQKYDFNDFLNLDVKSEFEALKHTQKLILQPSFKFKKYLRFLNSFVFEYAKINTNVVYSYRKEHSAYTAVKKHAESKYFFQTDLRSFFYSITADDVKNILENQMNDSPISDLQEYHVQLLNMVTVDGLLPVGFSTSPKISNSCLYEFDNELEQYCSENSIIYTRYSDDIILSSKNNNLESAETVISGMLTKFYGARFQLNANKTKHTHKGKKIKLLGMVILPSGKVSVDIKLKKQIEILFHFYLNDKAKFSDYLANKYQGDLGTISGQLNYINTIDKSYLNKLRKKYGNFIVDTFIHQTVNRL